MNILLEVLLDNSLLLDVFGVIGLGLVGLAAIRLATRFGTVGGSIMIWGVLALIVGRIGSLAFSTAMKAGLASQLDPLLLVMGRNVPVILLTAGLAAIVWGFWDHERSTSGESRVS